ncbi:nuclear transport factor 2 family protein [Roseococcus sp. DSY-14]|uniref:nuclear transport factor 2 family protein n=1 Tax=Roseococcus sp. DSY-14 TaxID=3369650 RepID=UPI00387B0085
MSDPTTAALAAEDRRFAALAAHDVDAVAALLADDLHYVHSNGAVEDKAEFLRMLSSGARRYRRYAVVRREARQEGGITLVFGESEAELEKAGGVIAMRMLYTAVYRGALLLAWHSVKAPGA